MSPVVFAVVFTNGVVKFVAKSNVPVPVSIAKVFAPVPPHINLTLEFAPAIVQAILLTVNRCDAPSPVDAIKVFALIFLMLASPVPSDSFVNAYAHADAWSFNFVEITESAILFFRYSFCEC